MAAPYTPTPTALPATVDLPEDGDAPEASLFNVPYEAILDALKRVEGGARWCQVTLPSTTVAHLAAWDLTSKIDDGLGGWLNPGPGSNYLAVPVAGTYKITVCGSGAVASGVSALLRVRTQVGSAGTVTDRTIIHARSSTTAVAFCKSFVMAIGVPDEFRIILRNESTVDLTLTVGECFLIVERLA